MVFLWVKEGSATQKRTAARDAEIKQLNSDLSEVKRTAEGIGRSLDEHYKEHNKWEDRIDNKFETMDGRLKIIEDNLIRRDEFLKVFDLIHVIDKRVAVISVRNEYEDKAAAAAARIGL
jgi:alkyl hydroperoxide reductase subunit AhpC